MSRLEFPTKRDYTKKRQNIDLLLKRAIKGNANAKKKLLDEYGIKIYSSSEIGQYEKGKRRRKIKKLNLSKVATGSKKQTVKTR